jgi:hypothetical protein
MAKRCGRLEDGVQLFKSKTLIQYKSRDSGQ